MKKLPLLNKIIQFFLNTVNAIECGYIHCKKRTNEIDGKAKPLQKAEITLVMAFKTRSTAFPKIVGQFERRFCILTNTKNCMA